MKATTELSCSCGQVHLRVDGPPIVNAECCCNTPVFLEFQGGHWLSLYGGLWPAGALPALEMRTMTIDFPAGTALPEDVPNAVRQNVSFFIKLLCAWIEMGFRSPKITVNGELHA